MRQGRWLVLSAQWDSSGATGLEQREAQWRHDLYAAIFSCSPRVRATVVCFRRTAAALWGLDGVEPGMVELAATSGRASSQRPVPHQGASSRPRSVRSMAFASLRSHGLSSTLAKLSAPQ